MPKDRLDFGCNTNCWAKVWSRKGAGRARRACSAALLCCVQSNVRVLKASGCNNLHEVTLQLPLTSPLQELWLNGCKWVWMSSARED